MAEDQQSEVERTQVHAHLPTSIVDRVDEFARQRGLSRTAAVAVLLARGLGMNGDAKH